MTDPIENLTLEHRAALEILDRLETLVAKDALDADDAKILKTIDDFFAKELDIHLRKEEEALFPPLEAFLGREGGPIGVMLSEHEDLRSSFDRFKQGVKNPHEQPDSSDPSIQEISRHIIDVLRGHIHKEDNVLFRMAAMHLTQDDLTEIGKKFRSIEEQGAGRGA
jgi:hemerythrin-like domain-containing protein